jgi:signal transduction histidine kinase
MSARSQHRTDGPIDGLNLGHSLRNCLASGVIVINGREQIVSATPEIERLLHLAPGKTVHAPLALLPGPLQIVVREAIASKTPIIRDHLTLKLTDKHCRDFHVTAQPILHEGRSFDVVVVLSDVTSFAQLEQGIARLDRLATLGTLSADMAHEIKNALVAVKTFVDLLLEKHHDEPLAGVVGREMRRLDTIMRQMLRFSGKERSTHGPVRLHDVLEHSLHMVQHQLAGKFISLNRSFNATPDAVHGNDHQLEQVFVNLLLNAVEASGPNGSLTVATELVAPASPRPGQRHVRITVADTGMGIAPENLDRMFEPFFTTKHHGTGLGLPITRRIVHEHNGHITVQSEPNKGTTFSILLPAGDSTH